VQIKLRSPQTAHQIFWEHNNCHHVYEYDPTDDGPECTLIRGIQASHPGLSTERADFEFEETMLDAVASRIRNPETLTREREALQLAALISVFADRLRFRGVIL
jgi:hypothetical protein